MDRARRVGGWLWVVVGLAFQGVAWWRASVLPGPVTLVLCGVVVLLAAATSSRSGWAVWLAGWAAAVLLGLDFAGVVADRLGALGPPGAVGVSWGGWRPFVDDTARLLPGAGEGLVTAAALAATTAEVALGVLLLSGWQRRWVGKATAGLLLVYLVSMAAALGPDAVATYALPLQVGGALLVSSAPARRPPAATKASLFPTSRASASEAS